MSWPTDEKSKCIIKVVEHCELSVFGDEMDSWSPTSSNNKNLIINRTNKLMNQIGFSEYLSLSLFKKIKIIANHLGVSLCEAESDESDEEVDILNESGD
tara:strand:+ start:135 stop:431 length:297 start_codon:yes stop_codon:yes gene_type:complete